MPLLSKALRSTLTRRDAELIAKALLIINEKPRFGPNDRRLGFDSYSLAGGLTDMLHRAGYDERELMHNLPRE